MSFSAVIVAAGGGTRAGPGLAKQWRPGAGKPVLRWSAEALLNAGARELVIVVSEEGEAMAADALAGLSGWITARGGATRAGSVQAGLNAIGGPADEPVLVHDAARPFVTSVHVRGLLIALIDADGAIPALPVADTLKREGPNGLTTTPREGLWRAQTPQAFRRDRLLAAYAAWQGDEPTDDAQVVEAQGGRVAIAPGDPMLLKLTFPEDFEMAERLAGGAPAARVRPG